MVIVDGSMGCQGCKPPHPGVQIVSISCSCWEKKWLNNSCLHEP